MRRRPPRWTLTVLVLVLAAGYAIWSYFDKPPEKCKPVIEMLNYNKSQSQLIESKGGTGTPTANDDLMYQQWADGLAERSQKVTDPALAAQAVQLAQLANEFVTDLPKVRAEKDTRAPGAPAPVIVYQMQALSDQITAVTNQLSKACS
ncbi:hypothetical protein MANY_35020 [Mycolicibacterium anyangense]|uniref:Uncharacterized protein n=1 Tax=Mycolicibacterium anyangense TaxID=1431246 RepID=A0A6N4WBM4_9MYCO|nr:hypothetical protein [Mycolicibacterium anyangense]BBZ78165.1 hypothetical protein MANY_35020 [Mycolicibacterium anyangense]